MVFLGVELPFCHLLYPKRRYGALRGTAYRCIAVIKNMDLAE